MIVKLTPKEVEALAQEVRARRIELIEVCVPETNPRETSETDVTSMFPKMTIKDILETFNFTLTPKVIIANGAQNVLRFNARDPEELRNALENFGNETVKEFLVYPEENYLYVKF